MFFLASVLLSRKCNVTDKPFIFVFENTHCMLLAKWYAIYSKFSFCIKSNWVSKKKLLLEIVNIINKYSHCLSIGISCTDTQSDPFLLLLTKKIYFWVGAPQPISASNNLLYSLDYAGYTTHMLSWQSLVANLEPWGL